MTQDSSMSVSLPPPWKLAEASDHLKVSTKHLRRLIKSGRLSAFRIGKLIYISDTEMRRLSGIGA